MAPANQTLKEQFRRAVNRLTETVTPELQYVARRMGLTLNSISRWQNDADPRNPQQGWEAAVAAEARAGADSYRRKAADLEALAAELEEAR